MSIQSEIERISTNISAAYNAVSEKGGTLPDDRNSDNLAAAIQAIPTGESVPGLPGEAAGFGEITATVDDGVGTPEVIVTASGPNTAKNLAFSFKNLKGNTGPQGPQGNQGAQGPQGVGYEVYAATETEIGTWLGKTLYRIVISSKMAASGSIKTLYTFPAKVAITRLEALITSSGQTTEFVNGIDGNGLWYEDKKIYTYSTSTTSLANATLYVIAEYTK